MRRHGKLAMEFITKEKSRRITYEKRKRCLMKKAQELSILCGVDSCIIIYDCYGSSIHPEIWPPSHDEVTRIISRYRNGKKVTSRADKSYGVYDCIQNRKKNLERELQKARMLNWRAKYPISDEAIGNLACEELISLAAKLDQQLDIAKKKLAMLVSKEESPRNPNATQVTPEENNGNYYIENNSQCDEEVNMSMCWNPGFPTEPQLPLGLPYFGQSVDCQLNRLFESEFMVQPTMSMQTNNDSDNWASCTCGTTYYSNNNTTFGFTNNVPSNTQRSDCGCSLVNYSEPTDQCCKISGCCIHGSTCPSSQNYCRESVWQNYNFPEGSRVPSNELWSVIQQGMMMSRPKPVQYDDGSTHTTRFQFQGLGGQHIQFMV